MFKTAELGRTISDAKFKKSARNLRTKLLLAQHQLERQAPFQVIVDILGVDGAGRNAVVDRLHTWLDTRLMITRSYTEKSDEERERPDYWRYWRDLPPRGRIGLYLRGRFEPPSLALLDERISEAEFESELDRITAFERDLAADGALILKFWLHLSRDEQKRRLEELEADPASNWRVTDTDWHHWRLYDRYVEVGERAITRTNTGSAPWIIVEATDPRYRDVTVAEKLLAAMVEKLEDRGVSPFDGEDSARPPKKDPLPPQPGGQPTVVSALRQPDAPATADYEQQLRELQAEHHLLQREARRRDVSSIYVFEGPDAGGKGGCIRRMVATLDARNYQVVQIAAPSDEEAAQPYLWRFWRRISRAGRLTVFDRSWYGRVLVERVEGFASRKAWRRAYAEINDFEEQLSDHGIVLAKFYLQITPEEQWRRFEARLTTPHKRWKVTEEDWRNRNHWWDHEQAAHDMIERTDTHHAPWSLIPANSKQVARLEVLRTACAALRARLDGLEDEATPS